MRKPESVESTKQNTKTKKNPKSKTRIDASETCLHHLFEKQAEKTPQAVALTFNGEENSYRSLNKRSNCIAHALLKIGVQPQQHVAMLLEPGPLQVESLFGILKAGAVFVCLDTAQPSDRLIKILEETKPAVLITDVSVFSRHTILLSKLKKFDIALFNLEKHDSVDGYESSYYGPDSLKEGSTTNPNVQTSPDNPAYIVYTSGSTGYPKGIVQSHRSFAQFIEWQSRKFGIVAPQRWAQWASIGYDASYCEIFGTLCFGATLCMADNRVRHDPTQLIDWARSEHITILQFVPSFCREVIEVLKSDATDGNHPLPDLRYLLLAGEPLPVDLAATWLYEFPNPPKLFNLYGPSETVLATYYEVKAVATNQHSIPIGRAIDGREILILGDELDHCSEGVRGEIYIRSPYLAMGYFQRPQETAAKFIQNPLHDDYPDPVYRTGDLGRSLPDGNIEFSGRTDNLVKIRGFRVELEEIEAVLHQQESVKEAVVVVHRDDSKSQQLVAYVVPVKGKIIDKKQLKQALKNRLPEYMVPAGCMVLEQLPRNANGKIDRKKLANIEWEKVADRRVFQPPINEVQLKLVRIWEQLLDLKHIGIHDNFFDIGGHSLLAVKLFDVIRKEFDKSLLPDTLIISPTIEELSAEISKAGWNPEHQAVVELQPYGEHPPFFCVPGALGGVMYMSDLAHSLKRRPFYGLRPQDLHFGHPPKLTIEDIATTLVREMRAIQPHGPYYLGGHSFGCAVAFEMTCQLQKAGEKIGRLIFFDYVADEIPLRPNRSLRGKFRDSIIEFLYRTGILEALRNAMNGKGKAPFSFWHNLFDIPLINVLAEKYHQAEKFHGSITLFRAVGDEYDPQLGLLKLAEYGVDTEYVPGDHNTLFKEPNVKILAKKLEDCLSGP